jgi:hypothetical protein
MVSVPLLMIVSLTAFIAVIARIAGVGGRTTRGAHRA